MLVLRFHRQPPLLLMYVDRSARVTSPCLECSLSRSVSRSQEAPERRSCTCVRPSPYLFLGRWENMLGVQAGSLQCALAALPSLSVRSCSVLGVNMPSGTEYCTSGATAVLSISSPWAIVAGERCRAFIFSMRLRSTFWRWYFQSSVVVISTPRYL